MIKNHSFEKIPNTDAGGIPDWIIEGVGGGGVEPTRREVRDPLTPHTDSLITTINQTIIAPINAVNPVNPVNPRSPYEVFADNGINPDGDHVAFLQCAAVDSAPGRGLNDVRLLQLVDGFEAGKSYVLQYHVNKNFSGSPPFLYVVLNQVDVDNLQIPLVEGPRYSHTRPYWRRISREFNCDTNGALQLLFILEGNYANNPNVPQEVRHVQRQGGVMLLDDVRIYELGNLTLSSARRSFHRPDTVTVKFSRKIQPATATNLINYNLGPGVLIQEATLGEDGMTVELRTSIIADEPARDLQVWGILDEEDRAMFRTNAVTPLVTAPYVPIEFTKELKGFEDDFLTGSWSPEWRVVGSNIFSVSDGSIKLQPGATGPSFLLYEADYDRSQQMILARVRFKDWTEGGPIGLAAALNPENSEGVSGGQVISGSVQKTHLENGSSLVGNPAMVPEKWHWMRLISTNQTHAMVKIWLDDPDTPEPEDWTSTLESNISFAGLAGIRGGPLNSQAIWEFDYVLICAEGLPFITPRLPQVAPPKMTITYDGLDLILEWTHPEPYILQTTTDLTEGFFDADPWWQPFEFPENYWTARISPAPHANTFFRLQKPEF